MNEQPLIDEKQEKILSLAGETQFAPNGIVSRTLLRTPNSRAVLFGFAEGQELLSVKGRNLVVLSPARLRLLLSQRLGE